MELKNEMEVYQELANAIIKQAAKDYKAAKKSRNSGRIAELRKFFRSSWFQVLAPNIDGDWLIRKLDEEAAHDGKRVLKAVSRIK